MSCLLVCWLVCTILLFASLNIVSKGNIFQVGLLVAATYILVTIYEAVLRLLVGIFSLNLFVLLLQKMPFNLFCAILLLCSHINID